MKIAIVKPIKVRVGNLAGLRSVIAYIKADDKTQNGELVFSKDMLNGKEFEQMLITKKIHHKTTGRQYAHFVQSFDRTDDITPEMAFEISQEFINRNDKFNDFQVVSAVHTNEKHMHIHYIVNSVSMEKGEKWQCSPKDLEKMRGISDDLCRENNLSVIEHGGTINMKYGEYKSYKSWKRQLASDIAECVHKSFRTEDFYHQLHQRGIDCDIGTRNIMFKVSDGYCGLNGDRLCSNFKLMPYGDFSRDNVLNSIDYNDFNRETAFSDIIHGIGELAHLDIFNLDHITEHTFVGNEDLKGKSKIEIEIIIAQSQARKRNEELTKAMQLKAEQDARNNSLLLTSLAGLCDEFVTWKQKKDYERYNIYNDQSQDQEYDDWEL